MTCTRFSLNSRNRSASEVLLHNFYRSSASEPSWRTSVPQTPFICPPPYPISKYATASDFEFLSSEIFIFIFFTFVLDFGVILDQELSSVFYGVNLCIDYFLLQLFPSYGLSLALFPPILLLRDVIWREGGISS